jgi:hypothetical protein
MSEDTLYNQAGGSPLVGYMLLKSEGKNVPPNWIKRYKKSRRDKHENIIIALKNKGFSGYSSLLEWEDNYQKECFYRGIRILMELEREGKSAY